MSLRPQHPVDSKILRARRALPDPRELEASLWVACLLLAVMIL